MTNLIKIISFTKGFLSGAATVLAVGIILSYNDIVHERDALKEKCERYQCYPYEPYKPYTDKNRKA